MATLCFLIGALMLLGCTGAGIYLMSQQAIVNLLTMAKIPSFAIIAVCFAVGLVFCLNWVVLGANCAQIRMLKRSRKKRAE